MKKKLVHTLLFFLLAAVSGYAARHTVTNQGFAFSPPTLMVTVGDTIVFDIEELHNVVEVSQSTWQNNGTTSNGGFQLGFGGGMVVITQARTYYYVCQPHAAEGMKGVIVAEAARQADAIYVASLSGSQEVLPVLSTGRGALRAELTGNQLVITGSFSDLSSPFNPNVAGGSHLHRGYAGQNGGIELALTPTLAGGNRGGVFEAARNTFMLTGDQLALLRQRRLYANIHTEAFPSGEIRGQLVPESDEIYYTNLFGSNEVPAVMSDGHGALVLEVRDDSLFVSGSFADLNGQYNAAIAGGSHLHQGMAGENGGILIGLSPELGGEQRSGVYDASVNRFPLTSTQRDQLERRAVYANIHTTRNAGGEIRGQVHEAATAVFRAFLAGSSEAPPVMTGAGGQLLLEVDGDDLTISGSFRGLESDFNPNIAGGAHIHQALAGSNGGVLFPLSINLDGDNRGGRLEALANQRSLTNSQLQAMFGREYYANIHTTTFAGGEIRGQVVPESQFFLNGFLSGTQEVTPVLTDGAGAVVAEVMGNRLTVSGSFAGLGSPFNAAIAGGAHLHFGLAGANGPVGFRLTTTVDADQLGGDFRAADNVFQLTAGQRDTLKARMIYANIHTQTYAGGELRAQLLPEANLYFFAPLAGANEAPPVRTPALGAVVAEWNGTSLVASGAFSGLSSDFNAAIAGGAHLHTAYAGRNGGVRLRLNATLAPGNRAGAFMAADNTFAPGAAFADTLRARLVYANIHTQTYAGGELRGQLLPAATSYFVTAAAGLNEAPPVVTSGRGALTLELTGNRLVVTGGFSDLASDFNAAIAGGSHLHLGAAGGNGAVSVGLNATLDAGNRSGVYRAADNTFTLNEGQAAALKSSLLYFNVHSIEAASGEIRGQVLPASNFFPTTPAITAPPSGAEITLEGLPTTPFLATWSAATDPDGDAVVYVWQLDTSAAFAAPLLNLSTGADTAFSSNFGTLSAVLASLGVLPGQTVKLYHRAIAGDGSLTSIGATDSVSLTLGVVSGFDEVLARQFQLRLFPVPASDWLQLDIQAEKAAAAQVQLIDRSGRLLQRTPLSLFTGANTHRLDIRQLNPGAYFVQVLIDGQPLRARQIAVQR